MLSWSFIDRMHTALASKARVIALLSPDYLQSDYCAAEWQGVLAIDPLNKRTRLIVLRVKECRPTGLLAAIAYWDLLPTGGNQDSVRQVLKAAISFRVEREAGPGASALWRAPTRTYHPAIHANLGFVGRTNSLAAMSNSFERARRRSPRGTFVYAIHGLGGVGKSTLAREMAWRDRKKYAGVWLVNGISQDRIANGLIELGKIYFRGLDENVDRLQAARRTLEFISDGGFSQPWLLIYDDVTNPRAMEGLLPTSNVHVLITSRWTDWDGISETLALDVLEDAASVSLLERRSGREDHKGAARLATELGCPLRSTTPGPTAVVPAWPLTRSASC
jgi:hypothetical protein